MRTLIKDYYSIMGVNIQASPDEIKTAYKKTALKLHPDKDREPGAEDRFKELQEAWTVLSDPHRRRMHDLEMSAHVYAREQETFMNAHNSANSNYNSTSRRGRAGFGSGFGGTGKGRNQYQQPQQAPFTAWNNGPHSTQSTWNKGRFPPGFFEEKQEAAKPSPTSKSKPSPPRPPPPPPTQYPPPPPPPPPPKKDDPILLDLNVSMEELCFGSTKKVTIDREVIGVDKRHEIEHEVIEVEVKPGWKEGTRITYPEKGDKHPGHIPADIVFTLKEKKHPIFVRDGADIRLNYKISLRDALCGMATFPCLDMNENEEHTNRIDFNLGKPIKPGHIHRFPGGGMPDRKNGCKRGDLIVTIDVQFPDHISDEVKGLAEKLPAFTDNDRT